MSYEAIFAERMKLPRIALEMERNGVTINTRVMAESAAKAEEASEELGAVCKGVARSYGYDLDLPRSGVNQSLRTFVLDIMKLPPIYSKKSKTDNPTIGKEAMVEWMLTAEPNSKELVFLTLLADKRKEDTSLQYMRAYDRFGLSFGQGSEWLRIHPHVNPTGTDTLRWSHTDPNSSNVSKQENECLRCQGDGCFKCDDTGVLDHNLRKFFGPAPGREWWSMDAKNIELRIPSYVSGEPELIALFERPNDPPFYGSQHLLNFSVIYPEIWEKELRIVGIEKVGPHCKKKYAATYYQWIKNLDFALQYQCGDATADKAAHRKGAKAILKARFAKQDALNTYHVRHANKYGYVETLPDKAVDPTRGYPLLCTRNERGTVKPTIPLAYFVSGSAMWWTARAMVQSQIPLDEWTRTEKQLHFIALQVHDELVFDFPAADIDIKTGKPRNLWKAMLIRKEMEKCGENLGVPTPVGCEYHADNWATGVSF